MFRASETEPQMSLFENPSDMMCKRAAKKYEDPKAWQNLFYRMVTLEIDESLLQPLFKEGRMDVPNASIRRLVAMSVLKEGLGCSDEDLMEKCDYDLSTLTANRYDACIAAVAHKKVEGLDILGLLKDKHVVFDVKCTLSKTIVDGRL